MSIQLLSRPFLVYHEGVGTKTKPKQLAFLLEQIGFEDSFQEQLWKDSQETALRDGNSVMMFAGRCILSEIQADFAHPALFGLVDASRFDGVLVSHIITSFLNDRQKEEFLGGFSGLPLVCIGEKPGNWSSTRIDNETGLRAMLRHLIQVHGCRRIAHIRGDLRIQDAEIRCRVWREELQAAGLPCGDELLVPGKFDVHKIPDITNTLFSQTGGNFDAVFACNDMVAVKIVNDLKARGLDVPRDVAVVGYDDIRFCQFLTPPLTTVRQPIPELIDASFKGLYGLMEGRDLHETLIHAPLIIRGSCGCPDLAWSPGCFSVVEKSAAWRTIMAGGNNPRIVQENSRNPTSELLALLARDNAFSAWMKENLGELNIFMDAIHLVSGPEQIPELLHRFLPSLGIQSYAVSLCCDQAGTVAGFTPSLLANQILPGPPGFLKPLAISPAPPSSDTAIFPARQLAPAGWLDARTPYFMGAFPLVSGQTWYGVAIMEIGLESSYACRTVQEQLSSVLAREARFAELVELGVHERTRTMLESEKMKALSTLVTGMAHEINTPVGNAITCTSFLKSSVDTLNLKFKDNNLSHIELQECILANGEGLDLIERNLGRTRRLIASFKKVSALNQDNAYEDFDFAVLLGDVLTLLKPGIAAVQASLEVVGPPAMVIKSYPSLLNEVLDNLVGNAISHGLADRPGGTIRLEYACPPSQESLDFSVTNDGMGIDGFDLPHIFEPFFTTHRSKGHTGLGLYIVYNIVVQRLGGTIQCNSTIEGGTAFRIQLPLPSPPPEPDSFR